MTTSISPNYYTDLSLTLISLSIPESQPLTLVVNLNRPQKRNALNALLFQEIKAVFETIGTRGEPFRSVLLKAEGKAFCAGIDTRDISFRFESHNDNVIDVARRTLSARHQILEMQQSLTAIEQCPLPVIAAIHGPCVGAGVDMACCADVRICAPSSRFGIREVRLGLAADLGTLQRFPQLVGSISRARELCYTGEDFDSKEAYRIGFVSRVSRDNDSLYTEALGICKKIGECSPVAVAVTKWSLNYSRDCSSVKDGLDHIATINSAALMTDDLGPSFTAVAREGKQNGFRNLLPYSRL